MTQQPRCQINQNDYLRCRQCLKFVFRVLISAFWQSKEFAQRYVIFQQGALNQTCCSCFGSCWVIFAPGYQNNVCFVRHKS